MEINPIPVLSLRRGFARLGLYLGRETGILYRGFFARVLFRVRLGAIVIVYDFRRRLGWAYAAVPCRENAQFLGVREMLWKFARVNPYAVAPIHCAHL